LIKGKETMIWSVFNRDQTKLRETERNICKNIFPATSAFDIAAIVDSFSAKMLKRPKN